MKIFLVVIFFVVIFSQSCKNQTTDPSSPNTLSLDQKVDSVLALMTLDEKIGQMTQVDRSFLEKEEDIKNYFLGSLLSGGGSSPSNNSPAGWADMYDRYQSFALQTRLKIPLLYGIDAVHGHNNVKGAVIFPHNIGMGATNNPSLVEEAARITAAEVYGTGIRWTFSPCIAVPRDERWGRTYEGFGEIPEITEAMSEAMVKGYQGNKLDLPGSILACAKHFVGDGGTEGGKDQGDTKINEATLRSIHMKGYISAIKARVKSIMASYNSWNGSKIHGNKYLLTEVLKNELGFKGFLVSDWEAIDQLPGDYKSDIETSINAGIDMVMVPRKYKEFLANLKSLVNDNKVPISRINDAVKRILKVKFELGLFEKPYTDRTFTPLIGSSSHREVARDCVRQSLVLLKNENNSLPISKSLKRIHVAGKNANNLGYQCGGWTISWQGGSGDITTGTTILQAIKNTVSLATNVTYSIDGLGAEGADFGIVVIGETPYAEGNGDRSDLNISQEDLLAIVKMKGAGIPVLTILISGRPMILGQALSISDALISAWLPGTEGQGVADVIFGDYNPTGRLTHSWPRTMGQIPINYGDSNYDPLFPYGFGLSY
ncbi:MAG: glycoside hydrolase family 3 C-terminal domain-containing protein [Bacteroidetes bacterium]|nr:glycoside hydrolase family 3 C-terminal domain-containing protein [Bacteroidota bacterium]MBU2585894.1 glycoside hydrolase family 3 C-terminal domain-containing protein [Bacteroidota bacterium]